MTEQFKTGDLVWAKMKGYKTWPARIIEPPIGLANRAKRTGNFCVFFYGSNNHGLVEKDNLKDYTTFKTTFENSVKSVQFRQGTEAIEKHFQMKLSDPTFDPDKELWEAEKERVEELAHQNASQFDKLKEDDTPVKKQRKSTGVKRQSQSKTPASSASSSKKARLTSGENGSSPAYVSNHSKNFSEILNRPTVFDLPEAPTVDLEKVPENFKHKTIEPPNKRFGFLGLGIMGSAIVKNLIISGHKVNIYNRSGNKDKAIKEQADKTNPGQVEVYNTPCDVVWHSDIIFCCVSDPDAVKQIIYGNCGVLHDMPSLSNKGYVEMTSIDSETSKDISNVITEHGGRYLEAQLQGSKQEAAEGQLIILTAGDKQLFDDCSSCFQAIGNHQYYLGEVGSASKVNLILQLVKGVALVGVAEGLALADRCGLAVKDVLEVFSLTNASSPFLQNKANMIVNMEFQAVEQPLEHMQKDMRLALHLADSMKQPLFLASTANEVYKHARRLGYDSYDVASVYMRTRH